MNHMQIKISMCLVASLLSACATTETPPPTKKTVEVVEETPKPEYIQVAEKEADMIGHKIWMNEGSAKIENLTAWNKGENFASLGIGHFIWYPTAQEGRFHETFPDLIEFLKQQGVETPAWLPADAPWKSYEAFQRDKDSSRMKELRTMLRNTIPHQVQFIILRLEKALPTMLNSLTSERKREHVREQFYQVANAGSNGIYALIDYVNFKGEGTKPTERYKGQGWGLLQVLENMSNEADDVMAEFAKSAEYVLKRRIQNSPAERNESRWFAGWKNRVKTYTYK
jgi:hypothetical protein